MGHRVRCSAGFLALFFAAFFCSPLAEAQTTQVTGQVLDSNGLPYAGAQMRAGLVFAGTPVSNPTVQISTLSQCKANGFGSAPCQVPFNPSNGPFNLDGGGNIPGGGITLQDNSLVTPSGTQWAFTVSTAGNPPPIGTGPQTCSATLTITGASQSVSSSFNACPKLSNTGGASAGATTATQIDANTFKATGFGVTAAGSEDCLAKFTVGGNTVTLSTNAVTPTASMVGWWMQGSSSCVDGPSYTNVLSRCQITSVNSGAKTLTGTGCSATAAASGLQNQHVTFAPLEDSQLAAAGAAAFGANSGPCPTLQMPTGFVYVSQPALNTFLCNTQATGNGSVGAHIQGWGRMSSRLGMTSDFNYAACPLFSGIDTCFFGAAGVTAMNMGITGFQNPGTNPAAATTIVNQTTDDFLFNFSLTGVGSALANLICVDFSGFGTTDWLIIADGCGGQSLNTSGGECSECVFLNSTSGSVVTGGFWATKQGGYGQGDSSNAKLTVNPTAVFSSDQDVYLWNPSVGQFGIDCSGTCYVEGMHFGLATPHANDQPIRVNAGGTVVAVGNKYTPGSAVQNITMNGGVYHDGCGNVYQTVKVNNLAGGGGSGTFVPCDDGTSTYGVAPVANMLNCASSASPAVCGGFISGSVVVAAAATTVTVNTTAIGANDEVILSEDSSLGTKLGVTCNTTPATALTVTARTAGTSFVITTNAPTTNPRCINYTIKK